MEELIKSFKQWFWGWLKGGPHFVVGGQTNPYMRRWYIIPRNFLFNIYLHQFLRNADDRALHDHPWNFISIMPKGGYYEIQGHGRYISQAGMAWTNMPKKWRECGTIAFRKANQAHRVELSEKHSNPWTIVITGPVVRVWGFHCPKGWVPWQEFVNSEDRGLVEKGCE